MKDLSQYRLVDIDQGKLLEGIQKEMNKAVAECIKRVTSTAVKLEIKFIPDKDESSQVKILCKYQAILPDHTHGDIGIIVDKTICTQMPVSRERVDEILDFTGETKAKLTLAK
jgi:hypothetical protein